MHWAKIKKQITMIHNNIIFFGAVFDIHLGIIEGN